MSKTTSDFLGLTLRDNNEFIDTEVDAGNFQKIDDEAKRLNGGTVCFAECTSTVNSDGKTKTHSITRPEKKSALIMFRLDAFYDKNDIVKIDSKAVNVKTLCSGADSFENAITSDAPMFGFYDEANTALYILPANPVVTDGFMQYRFGVERRMPIFEDLATGDKMIVEAHKAIAPVIVYSDGVTRSSEEIIFKKSGPLIVAAGILFVEYAGMAKDLLKISTLDGTAEGIDLADGQKYAIFINASNGYKIAKLGWVKSSDGESISLHLWWIYDLSTGSLATNGKYEVVIDSRYYTGY